MAAQGWKAGRDPLYRGDTEHGVRLPEPGADSSVVRHVLYLGGPGRPTPYLSTTESRETAGRFAGQGGRLYVTRVPAWRDAGVVHRSRRELVQLLRGYGKGDAAWPSAFEVMQARRYVEEHAEHLADCRPLSGTEEAELRTVVDTLFNKE
jgi:hypothetical protein